MNMLSRKRTFGFTVIELMIVVMIISVLVALAYPSYVQYARKAKRGEAQQLLMNWSINMEIWRSNNPCYETACGSGTPGVPAPSNDYYDFAASNLGSTSYTLTANATGDQAEDRARDGTNCSVLNLRSDGRKYSGNAPEIAVCWE